MKPSHLEEALEGDSLSVLNFGINVKNMFTFKYGIKISLIGLKDIPKEFSDASTRLRELDLQVQSNIKKKKC